MSLRLVDPNNSESFDVDTPHQPPQDKKTPSGGGGGSDMEARMAKLEASMNHVEREITDIRSDIRELRTDFKDVRKDMQTDFRIVFGALIGAALGLAGLMAKGFGWIG